MELVINPQFRNLLPKLTEAERTALEESIKSEGCRDPLIVWANTIVDGHNRYEICTENNIAFKVTYIDFRDDDEAMDWIDRNQLGRRNLTPDAFKLALGRRYNRVKMTYSEAASLKSRDQVDPGRTAEKLAAEHAVSPATVKRAGKFAEEVERSQILQDAIRDNIPVGKVIREKRREEQREQVKTVEPPKGKYQIIYADPPWQYQFGFDIHGAALRHYNTMSIEELCALPIKDLAEDNSVLFMWVTSPKLADCFQIIKAWGFDYKTSFVWDKVKHVMGHYNSVRHELLLICVRGSFPKQSNTLLDSVVTLERSDEHSEKPEEFREIIDQMYPYGKRIELFARTKIDGWETWGAEA